MSDAAQSGINESVTVKTEEESRFGTEGLLWKTAAESLLALHVNREVLMPLGANREAVLRIPRTITSDEWNRMMSMLRSMKAGLVSDEGLETWRCDRADGSSFIVELPSESKVIFSFEDPPEDQCAPGEPPPDVTVYCKGVQGVR